MRTRQTARKAALLLSFVTLSGMGAAACAKPKAPEPSETPIASSQASSSAAATSDASVEPDGGIDGSTSDASAIAFPSSLRLAIGARDWAAARTLLRAQSKETQASAVFRYADAVVSHGLRDEDAAIASLENLEAALPDLRERIARLRAEAAEDHGPYALATDYFLRKGTGASALRAARIFQKTHDAAGVERAVLAVLADRQRTTATEADARAIRIETRQAAGANASAIKDDADWIALHAPLHPKAQPATPLGEQAPEAPPVVTSFAQAKTRAEDLAAGGHIDQALGELRALEAQAKPIAPKSKLCLLRGQLLYHARNRYTQASTTFATCAAMGGPDQAESAFYEARSLSRANQDDEAIVKYEAMAAKFPRSAFVGEARYLRARLFTLTGRYAEAAKAWDALPPSDDKTRLRALSHLLAGHPQTALKLLEGELKPRGKKRSAGETLRLRELVALATDRVGKTSEALSLWLDIVREAPLSYAALVARARIADRNPSNLPKEAARSNLAAGELREALLPAGSAEFARWGFGAEAEEMVLAHERDVPTEPGRTRQATLCDAYLATGHAKWAYRKFASEEGSGCRYPTPFREMVSGASSKTGIEASFGYAVMRTESAFDPTVHSPAAAVGLMQLLPETATQVAQRNAIDEAPLENPHVNIRQGFHYLAELRKDLGGTMPLVAASYNAGPEAVLRWAKAARASQARAPKGAPLVDLPLLCELIPYAETRAYVFLVMESYAHYKAREGAEPPRFPLEIPAL